MSVNLGIKSILGFKRSTKRLEGPRPVMQTTKTLNGETFPDEGMAVETRVLVIDQLTDYNIRYENTSTAQTVRLTNFGNSSLTVELPVLASSDGVDPVFIFDPIDEVAGEINIPAGTTSTFQLAYYGKSLGTWSNALLFVTNTDVGNYKLVTEQTVSNIYDFDIVPNISTSTISVYARTQVTNFDIVQYQGVTESLTATLFGSVGYSIASYNTTTIAVQFDPNLVSNAQGEYSTVLTVVGNSVTHAATLTTVISFEADDYTNFGSWISPVSYYNSVIGVSYDKVDGRRTVTIGIGTGGEDIPEYTDDGEIYADLATLSISGDELVPKYPHWACVFRVPINEDGDTTPRTYFTGNLNFDGTPEYLDKLVEGSNYYEYFGDYSSQGSMFIIHDDGRGNIKIEMNRLRELSDDNLFNTTLQNLTRAFYYYSDADVPNRYPTDAAGNLDTLPLDAVGNFSTDGFLTKLFRGFLRNGTVVTSVVDIPQ